LWRAQPFAEELVSPNLHAGTGNHRRFRLSTTIFIREIDPMGPIEALRATALIVEDDPILQRQMICLLLEESDYDVIQCESAEAAQFVLERNGAHCG